MSSIEKLAQCFTKFPGIGSRQAKRFVYFLLNSNNKFNKELISSLMLLKNSVSQCKVCFRFYEHKTEQDGGICEVCDNPTVETNSLMIVEKDADLSSVQKSGIYYGRYFVLGGLVPLLPKNNSLARIKECLERVEHQSKHDGLKEVILALSANPEGDNTTALLEKNLKPLAQKYAFRISTLGRGLSTGTELEYSDEETIKNALENRK